MKDEIRKYISEIILKNKVEIDNDVKLYSGGILSSMAHLKLVSFLERTYGVTIRRSEMKLSNFDSVDQIAAFVESQRETGL